MRILLAARKTSVGNRPVGGVQTWIDTVDAELRRRGHKTKIWEPGVGFRGRFDLGILAHTRETGQMIGRCDRSIGISHGIVPLEKPSRHLRPDVLLAVSEEVEATWDGIQGVIRQPIDTDFWTPEPPAEGPRALTRFSYRQPEFLGPRVAARVGLEYRHLRHGTHKQLKTALCRSAAVLATGRAALEAAACGVPVVIYDHRAEYQLPLLSTEDPARLILRNYSGRKSTRGREPTLKELCRAIQNCVWAHRDNRASESGFLTRAWIVENHAVSRIVDELLEYAEIGVWAGC